MVMSSAQIAQMNGAFQQQNMQNMQHAGMIGMPGPMYGPGGGQNVAEGMMGGAMNRMSAIGAPMAMGGLALAGLDPFSMAIKGGMTGFKAGGMMGAGMGALGAAAIPAVGLMGAQYVGGQMMQGAQQQQVFNADMRSSFGFINAQGGRGFARPELAQIGSGIRGMAGAAGPGGEQVGFEELGRLASNMGRMGMAQGVRDAREFSEKFREMVKSLKSIATEMGTSLEQAQQVMSSLRSSGVFRNQGKVATQIAQGAVAGGLAQSEITGMMGIGSQISRMIGGRGEAGSRAGMGAITNVGAAIQTGVLNEEDIYNVTGQTGAEGRRAYATNMLQQSAQFLKGGLGRRALAAMAGKDGTLNQSSVDEFMAGGVGTGRTMQMAYQNLGKTGRANFIRNEGKLRGEVMAQMGGLAPAVVMRGWLQQRGMNVDEDDDRAMIFMQRRLGMGNDEAEQMVRMVKALPQLMRQKQQGAEDLDFSQKMQARARTTGIEGLKRKLEGAKSDVQNYLQEAGAEFYNEGTEVLESFINRLTGSYVKTMRRDAMQLFRGMRGGGAMGQQSRDMYLGKSLYGDMGSMGRQLGGGGVSMEKTFVQSGDFDRFSKAGYNMQSMGAGRGGLRGGLELAQGISDVFQTGGAADVGLKDELGQAFASGRIQGRGMERLDSFGKYLDAEAKKDSRFAKLSTKFKSAGALDQARMMNAMSRGAGVEGEAEMFATPESMGVYGAGGFGTVGERDLAVGKDLLAFARGGSEEQRKRAGTTGALAGGLIGAGAAVALGPLGLVAGALGFAKGGDKAGRGLLEAVKDKVDSTLYGGTSRSISRAAGTFLGSEAGRDISLKALSMDADVREDARSDVMSRLQKLQNRKGLGQISDAESGELEALRGVLAAQDMGKLSAKYKGFENIPKEELERLAEKNGMNVKDFVQRAGAIGGNAMAARAEVVSTLAERLGGQAKDRVRAMKRGGVLSVDETGKVTLGADMQAQAIKAGKGQGALFSALAMEQVEYSGMEVGGDVEANRKRLEGGMSKADAAREAAKGMSVAQLRKEAELATAAGETGIAQDIRYTASIRGRLEGKRGQGAVGAAASLLGAGLKRGDIQQAYSKGFGGLTGDAAAAAMMADQMGVSAKGAMGDQLKQIVEAARTGKTGEATDLIKGLSENKEFQEAQKKRIDRENPEQAALNKIDSNTKALADSMKTAVAALQQISTNTGKSEGGEDKPG